MPCKRKSEKAGSVMVVKVSHPGTLGLFPKNIPDCAVVRLK